MRRGLAITALMLAVVAGPAVASAAAQVPHLGDAQALGNGFYRVTLRTGPAQTTHGADTRAAPALGALPPRRPRCAPTHHQRVLYGRPLAAGDRIGEALPRIEAALAGANAELDRAALESGGRHADLRVACSPTGELQVELFVNTGSSSFSDVVDAARIAGATDPAADYLIFYDDPAARACGVASFTPDDRAGVDNANNAGGGYAVLYPDCWNAGTVLHEVAHTQGAVQSGGPNATGAGHCRDEADVMCYADGAEGAAGMLSRCPAERLDCGYDDYFDVAPEAGEHLASAWNLGSAHNRFIDLGEPGQPPADPFAEDDADPGADVGEEDGEPADVAPVRIADRRVRVRGGRVRVRLDCPRARPTACRGRVELLRGRGQTAISKRAPFAIAAGARVTVTLRLGHRALRDWRAGRLRRVRVLADEPEALAARVVALTRR